MFDKMCGRKSEDGFQYFEKRKIQRPVFHKASISIVVVTMLVYLAYL